MKHPFRAPAGLGRLGSSAGPENWPNRVSAATSTRPMRRTTSPGPMSACSVRSQRRFHTSSALACPAHTQTARCSQAPGVARHAEAEGERVLYRGFDHDLQLPYALGLVKRLGYDLERGRQDLSTHPFSTAFGPGDVRIPPRVCRDFFNECLFGPIHESGHAMYNQGMGADIDRTPLWGGASPGVHESQSRLWENLVGRSPAFWRHFYPSLRSVFPEPLRDVDEEAFYRAVNRSYPSLIRVEADEVTYNMHVLLRFELENEMLEGTLNVQDLPEAWNALFKSYLGLNVPNDREGALQDIHWSYVSFGIFPGYTIGNLIGAQLMEKIRTEMA